MRRAFNAYRAGAEISSTCIYVFNRQTLQSLNDTGAKREAVLRLLDDADHLVKLNETVSRLKRCLVVCVGIKLMGSWLAIALSVGSSHLGAKLPRRGPLFLALCVRSQSVYYHTQSF